MFKILDAYMRPSGLRGCTNLNLYRVYKNPEARDLYLKAQWESAQFQRADLYAKMGEYELVDETPKTAPIHKTILSIFKDAIRTTKDWYSLK